MQARQGDIFFNKVSEKQLPKTNGKRIQTPTLAYGEVTGHAHVIMTPSISELDSVVDTNGDIYVKSEVQDIVVGHDEHDQITLPKGEWYRISRQREYDALAAARERVVAD